MKLCRSLWNYFLGMGTKIARFQQVGISLSMMSQLMDYRNRSLLVMSTSVINYPPIHSATLHNPPHLVALSYLKTWNITRAKDSKREELKDSAMTHGHTRAPKIVAAYSLALTGRLLLAATIYICGGNVGFVDSCKP